jgi:hypothetical protein
MITTLATLGINMDGKWLIMGYGGYRPSYLITSDDGLSWTKYLAKATLFDSYAEALEVRPQVRSKWVRNISIIRLADVPDKPS